MISLKEAGERIGRSPDTLRKAAERGTLAARKVGNTWMTTVEEADRYARENVGKPGPKPKRNDLMIGMVLPITPDDITNCGWEAIIAASPERNCHDYEYLFIEKAEEAKKVGDFGRLAALALLGAACDMFLKPDDPDVPLYPKMIFREMRTTAVQDFRDDQLSVLSQIYQAITDAELRARLADILWLRKSDGRAAAIAVDSYLAAATGLSQDEYPAFERVHRAYQIAWRLGRRVGHLAKVLSHIETKVCEFDGNEVTVMPLRYMGLLLDAKHGEPTVYIPLATRLAETSEAKREWFRARDYWRNVAAWQKRAANADAEREALIRAAKTYIADANDAITPPRASYMTAAAHLASAIEAYKDIPGTEMTRESLLKTMLDYQKKGLSEMAQFPFEINVTEYVEKATNLVRGKPLIQALVALAGCSASPRIAEMRSSVKETLERFPMQAIMPNVTFNSSGIVVDKIPGSISDDPKDQEAVIVAGMLKHLRLHHNLHAFGVIEPARGQIVSEHAVTIDDLAQLVMNNPLVPSGREVIYARGLLAGLNGDYLVSTHLLAPQIENSLRYVLHAKNVNIFQIDNDGIQREMGLDRILVRPECANVLIEVFGDDLIFDLRALLIEPLGGKLRHVMAHGLMDTNEFATASVVYLWWLTLRFCCLPFLVGPISQQPSSE